MQVGIIAKAKERLRVVQKYLWVEVLDELDLVRTADRGEDRLVLLIGKGSHDVASPVVQG